MSFDAAAGQMNEESGHQHLSNGNHVSGQHLARSPHRERDREDGDDAAQEDGCPNVNVDMANGASPCARRNYNRGDDTGYPLEAHKSSEKAVNALVVRVPAFVEQK